MRQTLVIYIIGYILLLLSHYYFLIVRKEIFEDFHSVSSTYEKHDMTFQIFDPTVYFIFL